MKVLQINAVPYGSTGKIMFSLADMIKNNGGDVLCTSGFTWRKVKREDFFLTSGLIGKTIHMFLAYMTGYNGCFSFLATWLLIKKVKKFKPDIIHLHNIHGWYVNIPMLFRYLKQNKKIKVFWTLHDCWAVTGQCPHFTMVGCDKWKHGCYNCEQYKYYPKSRVDRSRQMYELKKRWFNGIDNLIIITPSRWLEEIVSQSFLQNYNVRVINNGLNLSIFKPRESGFRKKLNLENKFVILGVAYAWDEKKGLDVFVKLTERLDEKYKIVLVGTDEEVDKNIPDTIISIRRTQNAEELAEIYTAADVFVNPTREENYPTVHMEALACGTPVITFETGGASEMLSRSCGTSVKYGDVDALEKEIKHVCRNQPYSKEACINHAKKFDERKRYKEYMDLYGSVL